MNKNKELLNEYQKGYIHCLCNVISRGSKKVSDDLDDLLFEIGASEDEFKTAIEEIASQYDIGLYIDHYTDEMRVDGEAVMNKPDGTKEKVSGVIPIETFSLVLYKNQGDLDRFLQLTKSGVRDDADYHRELGRLCGYGEKEIEKFIENHFREETE